MSAKWWILVLCGCGSAPYELGEGHAIAEPSIPASPLAGSWTGEGKQSDGANWRIKLDVISVTPGMCAHVRYPDLDCAGTWTCTQVSEHEMHAFEHITQGRDRCIDNEVDVQFQEDGTLALDAHADGITAEAHLAR
jgi:hypothetical protein